MKTALLLIDIQNDYFKNGAMRLVGSDAACENARLLLETFRSTNRPIIHVQHVATKPTATFFIPSTPGVEIHPAVKPASGEKVIIKHFPNSFRETDLLVHLQSLAITDVTICGMMTHMCVDATTRAARDFGFNCTVVGDSCATRDLEIFDQTVRADHVQKSFLAALDYFYSTVVTTAQYIDKIQPS